MRLIGFYKSWVSPKKVVCDIEGHDSCTEARWEYRVTQTRFSVPIHRKMSSWVSKLWFLECENNHICMENLMKISAKTNKRTNKNKHNPDWNTSWASNLKQGSYLLTPPRIIPWIDPNLIVWIYLFCRAVHCQPVGGWESLVKAKRLLFPKSVFLEVFAKDNQSPIKVTLCSLNYNMWSASNKMLIFILISSGWEFYWVLFNWGMFNWKVNISFYPNFEKSVDPFQTQLKKKKSLYFF